MLENFRWYRRLRGGIWQKVQVKQALGMPEFWTRNPPPSHYGTIVEREFYSPFDASDFHDGDHSVAELYDHRCMLYSLAISALGGWKSRLHEDGTGWEGWFIAGVPLPTGDITYHLPDKFWNLCHATELERGRPWDGHTSQDVLKRISTYLASGMYIGDRVSTAISCMSDPDYAWSWHCNLTMMAVDAGADHKRANEQAACFMANAFAIDIRVLCPHEWQSLGIDDALS